MHLIPLGDCNSATFERVKGLLLAELQEDVEIHHFRGHFSKLSYEDQAVTLSLLQTLLEVRPSGRMLMLHVEVLLTCNLRVNLSSVTFCNAKVLPAR